MKKEPTVPEVVRWAAFAAANLGDLCKLAIKMRYVGMAGNYAKDAATAAYYAIGRDE